MVESVRLAVLVPQDLEYGRGVLHGVYSYALQHTDWFLHQAPATPEVLPSLRQWRPTGVIAHLIDSDTAKGVSKLGVPVVNTTTTIADWAGPLVEVDNASVGRLAAEYFLRRGYRSFGYLGSGWAGFSLEREAAFRAEIAKAGMPISPCHLNYLPHPPQNVSWTQIDSTMRKWLTSLKKPAAVLTSNDRPGRELINTCAVLGLRVPDDVAVLGVDNDQYECLIARPPLSSIVNPAEAIGRRAAELMAALLAGRKPAETRILIPALRLVERQSTDSHSVDDPIVRKALELIRVEATNGLTAAHVHESIDVSRRQLERLFREAVGRSILEEIRRVRLQRATELLGETRLSLESVASRSGFGSARSFAKDFRRAYEMTPTEFRANELSTR